MRRVFDLKIALRELTTVPEERQKILGLVKGKLPPDQVRMYVSRSRAPWMYRGCCAGGSCGGADYSGAEGTSISPMGRSLRWSERLKDTKSKTRMVHSNLPVGLR